MRRIGTMGWLFVCVAGALLLVAHSLSSVCADSIRVIDTNWGTDEKGKWVLDTDRAHLIRVTRDEDSAVRIGRRIITGYPEGDTFGVLSARERFLALQFDLPAELKGKQVVAARVILQSRNAFVGEGLDFLVNSSGEIEPVPWRFEESYGLPPETFPVRLWSPNIARLVNPALQNGDERISLTISPTGERRESVIRTIQSSSFSSRPEEAPILLLYEKPVDCLIGRELLGRPTDTSVDFSVISIAPLDIRVIYNERGTTSTNTIQASMMEGLYYEPCVFTISGLKPSTAYEYELQVRLKSVGEYETAGRGSFHTARKVGESFTFQVIADEHLQNKLLHGHARALDQYHLTLLDMMDDPGDFVISMGDFAHPEFYDGRNAVTGFDAYQRYLDQREFMGMAGFTRPFFLTVGNHEGEQGWYLDGTPNNLSVWSSLARNKAILCPVEPGFYTTFHGGNKFTGPRGATFAFTWGDALFVVIDPYFYTERNPRRRADGSRWDWTLGLEQYNWLNEVLSSSDAKWKFIFTHQLVGGINSYGRGGIEAVKHRVVGRPSFEMGGEDETGKNIFSEMRPGWEHGPLHDMFVREGVRAVFHGHDHCFVHQELDGIAYVECPMPGDEQYLRSFHQAGNYEKGHFEPGCGYVRVTVQPDKSVVSFIRQPFADEGEDASEAYAFTMPARR